MAALRPVYVLQSGFVTYNGAFLLKDAERQQTIKDAILMSDHGPQDTNHFYDEGIERLFQAYMAKKDLVKEFSFRESLFKEYYRVFSAEGSFSDWVRLQLTQRSVGYMHRQFIQDTINFIVANRFSDTPARRKMEVQFYYSLLQANEISRHLKGKDDYTKYLEEYIRDTDLKFDSLLYDWTGDEALLVDLIHSLHVIFGRRVANRSDSGIVV